MLITTLMLVGALQAPETTWTATVAGPGEPGEPLVVSGVVYRADGRTPVAGAVLYVYQTDAQGNYRRPGEAAGQPRLRGWMKTDSLGRYEFRTIRPAPYPRSAVPAHIHAQLRLPDGTGVTVREYLFEGDPNAPGEDYRDHARLGRFSPLLTPTRGDDGIWRATRDFRAGR